MKLSNKILVAFFGFIFIYISAAFAELRLTGTPTVYDGKNGTVEELDLPNITYLVLKNLDQTIEVVAAQKPQFEVRSLSGALLKEIDYQFSGDTLTISALPQEKRTSVKITLFVPKSVFKGMSVTNSAVVVKGLHQESLSIVQNAGRIWMSDGSIGKIDLVATRKSLLEISEMRLDSLSAEFSESTLQLSSPVGLLQGSMTDDSFLHLRDADEIRFKKDRSSKINLY